MAAHRPLVISGGRIRRLPSGDTIAGPVAEVDVMSAINGDGGSHVLGDVVYISAAGTVSKARANALSTSDAIAFATATILTTATGSYQTNGLLTGLSGLTAGARYYLSAGTAGAMVTTAPDATTSEFVVPLGFAMSTTEFLIEIHPPTGLG